MSSGRIYNIIIIIILVISFIFQGALGETPPPHENFEEAEQSIEILLSLLEDSKTLSEESLYYLVHMDFSPENLSIAMEKANEFHELLLGVEILLNDMKGEATSNEYLTEYLTSFQNLDINITSLIQFYTYLSENLTVVEDYLEDTTNTNITVDSAVDSLNNSESNTEAVKKKVDDIENNTQTINEKGFSTDILEELIIDTKELLNSDEDAIDEFEELFAVIPNFLSIYINKTEFALGDELAGYGYFFGEGSFKTGQNITVFLDDQILDKVSANSTGRYEFKNEIPLNHTLGQFEIHASTIYNDSLYISDTINIVFGKIPTQLTLSTPHQTYSPNISIPLSGRLVDYRNRGIANANITLHFDDPLGNARNFNNITITKITTKIEGHFRFELNITDIPLGRYIASAEYESDEVYNGSVSGIVDVALNIPTNLTLSILEIAVYEGGNITFFGQLIDELDNIPLSDMTLELFIEDEKVGEVMTDSSGRYEYVYSTSGMASGAYNVHSEFNPNDMRWREAISNIIDVEIREPEKPAPSASKSLIATIYDNLFLITILILVFLFPTLLYINKKRKAQSPARQTQPFQKSLKKKSYPKEALTKELVKETEDFDSQLRLLIKTKDLREAIIVGYNIILSKIEKYKIIKIEPSHTHLDIAEKLTDRGFPITETRSITKIFEKAMYSNRPIESRTLDDFSKGIRKMFTLAGGIKA